MVKSIISNKNTPTFIAASWISYDKSQESFGSQNVQMITIGGNSVPAGERKTYRAWIMSTWAKSRVSARAPRDSIVRLLDLAGKIDGGATKWLHCAAAEPGRLLKTPDD